MSSLHATTPTMIPASFTSIATQVAPAVVFIKAEREVQVTIPYGFQSPFEDRDESLGFQIAYDRSFDRSALALKPTDS